MRLAKWIITWSAWSSTFAFIAISTNRAATPGTFWMLVIILGPPILHATSAIVPWE
jgi:hypothetical protein